MNTYTCVVSYPTDELVSSVTSDSITDTATDLTQTIRLEYMPAGGEKVSSSSVPKIIPIKSRLEIRGVLYVKDNLSDKNKIHALIDSKKASTELKEFKFCAFHIFHCNKPK